MHVTLYIADKRINAFMQAADLCGGGKVFVSPVTVDMTRKGKGSTKEFLQRILKLPPNDGSYWVPAAGADGEIVVVDGINQLSDGKNILFVGDRV